MSMNYLGLHSLRNRGFRQLIRSYFMSGDRVPDVMVLNSRLHDGCYWTSVRIYAQAADFAAQFWSGVMDKVRARGHAVPRVFYRTQMPQVISRDPGWYRCREKPRDSLHGIER
ncbi:hypothetical protein ZEAMMB73_Zm00001d019724 [Zea mays]|uniref:Uncharacterized protein n=1 Tax=Zea mays TaxID=4577 RepID=A0A1D6I041_MAIZE|nr:hypothetical protein ZEAMMB73_Zm00001d019724 [Zea mays]